MRPAADARQDRLDACIHRPAWHLQPQNPAAPSYQYSCGPARGGCNASLPVGGGGTAAAPAPPTAYPSGHPPRSAPPRRLCGLRPAPAPEGGGGGGPGCGVVLWWPVRVLAVRGRWLLRCHLPPAAGGGSPAGLGRCRCKGGAGDVRKDIWTAVQHVHAACIRWTARVANAVLRSARST